MSALKGLVVVCGLAVWGCGGDDQASGHTIAPAAIEGGGVKGPALKGVINAYVLDTSGNPIEHASLVLGEGGGAKVVAETNEKGFARIEDAALVDKVVLGANASGFVETIYAGVAGSLVTFVLSPTTPATDTIVAAASITGWDALPAPPAGKYRAARAVASLPVSLATFDALAPAEKDDCFAGSPCAFTLEIPAKAERVLAVIVDGDEAGTPADRSDDTLSVTALAVADVPANGSDLSLELLANEKVAEANVSVGSATGLVGVIGVPGVSANGQVTVYPSFPGTTSAFLVPTAADTLADANLWAVAFAESSAGDARSLVVTRGIQAPKTAPTEPLALTLGDFLSPPAVSVAGSTLQITRAPSAAVHQIALGGATPRQVWILDDRSSFELPSDATASALTVSATDAPFDALDFQVSQLAATLTRRAVQVGN